MGVISAPVGEGKDNRKDDVIIVQRLLNGLIGRLVPMSPVTESGNCDSQTIALIREFQSRIMRLAKPDGWIGPSGPTLLALTGGANVHIRPDKDPSKFPKHVNDFIQMALPPARRVKATWKVPVGGLIAQAAVESGWGRSVKDNAYFGIKGKSPSGSSTSFETTEVIDGKVIKITDTFRAYKDFEDSADDYGRFLNSNARYKAALGYPNDPLNFVKEVARAGYATSPNYATTLTSVIRSFGLEQYDR